MIGLGYGLLHPIRVRGIIKAYPHWPWTPGWGCVCQAVYCGSSEGWPGTPLSILKSWEGSLMPSEVQWREVGSHPWTLPWICQSGPERGGPWGQVHLKCFFFSHVIVIDIFFFIIRGKLLYNVVVVSAIWQYEPAIIKHTSPPSRAPSVPPSHPL